MLLSRRAVLGARGCCQIVSGRPLRSLPLRRSFAAQQPQPQTPSTDEKPPAVDPRPRRPNTNGLTFTAAKRILAPHLFPLSTSSPWRQARDEMKLKRQQQQQATKESDGQGKEAREQLRRPYKFVRSLAHHWLRRLAHLLEYGLSSEGNAVDIYFDGDQAFEAMFDAVDRAQKRVYLETFMFKMDRVGTRVVHSLTKAADRGCQVMLLYDAAGSFSLFPSHVAELAAHKNAHVIAFNPVLGAILGWTNKDFSHRTHRKILVADDIAFTGGSNTSEQYAGPRLGINEFRDTNMRIIGPGVEHLAEVFHQSVQEAYAHDKATWRRIFQTVRARTGTRVTSSEVFNSILDRLATSGTRSGERAASFFEQAREREKRKMEELERVEKELQDVRLSKENGGSMSQSLATPNLSRSPTPARTSFRTLRLFLSHRLHIFAEASSSPSSFAAFSKLESEAARAWTKAWRRVGEAARGVRDRRHAKKAAKAGVPVSETPAANAADSSASTPKTIVIDSKRPALAPSPMSALASSISHSHIPPSRPSTVTLGGQATVPQDVSTTSSSSSTFQNVFLQVLPSNTIRQQLTIQNALVDVIENSMDYVLITNPFLLPPLAIKNAILNAGKRGVRIRIICGGKSDTPFMRWSSQHIYHTFLAEKSIEIFEYQPRILHAKTTTIDGLYSSIGSFNLDFLSSHKLLEINIGMLSNEVARVMEQQHDEDLKDCVQVTKESLAQRSLPEKTLHWFAYHASRFVYSLME